MVEKLKKTEIKIKKSAIKKIKEEGLESAELKDEVLKALEDGKADNIEVIDIKGKSSIADYIIVASGTSSRHIYSLADNVLRKLKTEHQINPIIDGKSGTDWVVIDIYDVILHIFHPETRAFYDIEEIWQ